MENYGAALQLAGVAADSAGTSLEKFAAYEDSIAAKANNFVASLESLSFNTFDAGFIKGTIDAGAALITLIDHLDLLKISLNTIAAVGAVKGFGELKSKIADETVIVEAYETAQSILNGTYSSASVYGY